MIDPRRFAPSVSEEAKAAQIAASAGPAAPLGDIAALRAHYDSFNRRHLDKALAQYPVEIARADVGGVPVDIVTPSEGTATDCTLICLHGGAFVWGRGAGALLEAVPIAATMRARVIAVEYALAPEAVFPAAVDDVGKVYRSLLETLPASRIGIYGCSAGAVLTAQVVARLLAQRQSLPGAVAMLCGAGLDMLGDSAMVAGPLTGAPAATATPILADLPYLARADPADALVFPGNHPELLGAFPPSFLATGFRDFAASSVMTMHRRLLAAGAAAELLCFDGMPHAFHMDTTLPESRELFAALTQFFARHLR